MPGYPPKLEMVLMQALEKDPAKRFPTANEMLRALDQALPASARVSTDDDVSNFVKALLGERHEKRKAAIREALRIADDRTDATKLMRPLRSSADASNPGMPPLSAAGATDVLNAVTGSGTTDPKSERWTFASGSTETSPGTGSGPSLMQAVESGPLLAPLDISQMSQPRASKAVLPATWIALVALVVAGAAVIGMVVAFRSKEPAQPAVVPPSVQSAPAPQSANVPSSSASEAAPVGAGGPAASIDVRELPVASASATAPKGPGPAAPPGPKTAAVPTAPKTAPPTQPTAPATTKSLPQVRNPGF